MSAGALWPPGSRKNSPDPGLMSKMTLVGVPQDLLSGAWDQRMPAPKGPHMCWKSHTCRPPSPHPTQQTHTCQGPTLSRNPEPGMQAAARVLWAGRAPSPTPAAGTLAVSLGDCQCGEQGGLLADSRRAPGS